jgi:predicted enzyme related to lactoylglutathione lyase
MPNPISNSIVHFEIGCKDKPATQAFYTQLFDWKIDDGMPSYIHTGGEHAITGHLNSLGHEPHNYTVVYVHVDDVPAYMKKAIELGGKVLVPEIPIPTGSFAWIADPEGTIVGLFRRNA